MSNHARLMNRFYLLALPLVLAGSLWIHHRAFAADPAVPAQSSAFDYTDQVSRLVQAQDIDQLAKLNIPGNSPEATQLRDWTAAYVSDLTKADQERQKEYNEAVSKAAEDFKNDKFDGAVANLLGAYEIAKDQNEFLKLDWVKDLTAKVAERASDYEKQAKWIESYQLYTDLNSLYEIDTRYKPDMQRLARRIRLLAMYVPQTYYDMRKVLIEKQIKERAATQPAGAAATQAADEDLTPPTFTRWQDYVENAAMDMGTDSIERARIDWVENTTYDTLVKGGVDALRLFLTTPELSQEFPKLADPIARADFEKALDGALARDASGKEMSAEDMERILTGLVEASDATVKLPKEVVIMEFTDGAMEKLDPFTAVIWPHELSEFDKNMRGTFGGVGVQIEMIAGKLTVASPLEDTPAYKAGIVAGDIIAGIDGKSAIGISIDQAVHSITGKPGTPVVLRIKHGNNPAKDYTLIRDLIKVASVKGFQRHAADTSKWDYMIDPDTKIGYIRITGFQEDTADELKATLLKLQDEGMRGIILDLRFNPGGLLKAAVDISDMFLQDGVIVSTKGRSANTHESKWSARGDTVVPPTMPLIVMVNQYSASASEIFSGAMQDLHRGLIVGHRSFGKGSVQNLLPIGSEHGTDGSYEAEMKLTTSYYYLPNNESLHRRDGNKKWGVDPDVPVFVTPDQLLDLNEQRRDNDILHTSGDVPQTQPTTKKAPIADTQLDTAILMMRLQLLQAHA
jgi:carboxyl-terminal processing protease